MTDGVVEKTGNNERTGPVPQLGQIDSEMMFLTGSNDALLAAAFRRASRQLATHGTLSHGKSGFAGATATGHAPRAPADVPH